MKEEFVMHNKQVLTTELGDYSVMKIVETVLDLPKLNEVQIKILYTGIAWADVVMRHGAYPKQPKMPFVQGYDIVGEVVNVGENVDKTWIGKKIVAIIQWGGYSQFINVPLKRIIEIPFQLDLAKVECLLLNYVAAYQALHRYAKVKKGNVILVHGAAGGVGTALLQLAAIAKVKVYGTASLPKKNIVIENGAIYIDYKNEDFRVVVENKELNGIDAFFDFNGGKIFDNSFKLLKKSGKGLVFNIQEAKSTFQAGKYILKFITKSIFTSKKIHFYSIMGDYKKHPEHYVEDLGQLFDLLRENKINPVIAKVITLDDIPMAHKDFEENKFTGKLVVKNE